MRLSPREIEELSMRRMMRDPSGINALIEDSRNAPAASPQPAASMAAPPSASMAVPPSAREAEEMSMGRLRRDPSGVGAAVDDAVSPHGGTFAPIAGFLKATSPLYQIYKNWNFGNPNARPPIDERDKPFQGPPMPPELPAEAGPPAEAAPPPAPATAPVNPYAIDPASLTPDVQQWQEFLRGIMPQRPDTSGAYKEAMDYANRDKERTRLLARLALASGITASAGGQWKSVAQGLSAAGAVYDDGFKRYQQTLEKAAQRDVDNANQAYEEEAGIAESAFKAALAGRQTQLKNVADPLKSRIDQWKWLYEDELNAAKPQEDEGGFITPEARAESERRRRDIYARIGKTAQDGQFYPPTIDVRD